jgi:hypothetical protein
MGLLTLKDKRVSAGSWGESKQRVNVMLTPTAIAAIDGVADELGLTRSEVLERLARSPSLNSDELKDIVGESKD